MKKLRYIWAIVCVTILFASCSSNDTDSGIDEKKYPVTFNISNFSHDTSPLNSEKADENIVRSYKYTIYDETGKAVLHDEAKLPLIKFELPKGNYKISVISHRLLSNHPIIEHDNFNSDYCFGNAWVATGSDNYEMYLENKDFSVDGKNDQSVDIKLQPMWSEILVNITDAETCFIPNGCNFMLCVVEPYYYGFGIKDKVPTQKADNSPITTPSPGISVDKFKELKYIGPRFIARSNDITVKIIYWTQSANDAGSSLGEKVIYKGNFLAGNRYLLTGELGNEENNISGEFNVTSKGLEEADRIPF
ncbi:hypothetical protein [Prevotella sp. 10(H)]|uniref:hypothetical protein n=1 Tax=Prevotella sp. 10(H) TaxID=1158294 RepID=UPI0004A6BB0D|nr:hypothetical protein [Prevotella sp. 10(H)]